MVGLQADRTAGHQLSSAVGVAGFTIARLSSFRRWRTGVGCMLCRLSGGSSRSSTSRSRRPKRSLSSKGIVTTTQVVVHPLRESHFVDARRAGCLSQNGAQSAPKRGELVISAEVHRHDTQPQRVVRTLTARPASGASKTRIDETALDEQSEATTQILCAGLINPPAIEAGSVDGSLASIGERFG